MKKRFLAALLALCMVFALGTVSALADEEDTGTTCNGEECSHAAAIGTTHYNTLAGAIDAAEAATTDTVITLLNNVDETIDITKSNSGKIILDFDGEELEVGRINLKQGTLTVRNGTLTPAASVAQPLNIYGANDDTANSELNIESTLTIMDAEYGICLFGNGVSSDEANYGNGYGAVVNFNGKIISDVNGSTGIFVSGNLGNSKESGSAISNAAYPNVININSGSKIDVTGDQGIAMNGQAIVNVKSGASITGREAIGVKRGVLNITGGTFVGNGANATDPVSANNNGTEASGAAISVTSTYNKYGSLEVNISGGSFTSENSAAVYVGHSMGSSAANAYEKGFDVNITDGTFKTESTNENVTAVFVADKIASDNDSYNNKVVTGGRFLKGAAADTSVSDYIPDDVSMKVDTTTGEVVVDDAKTVATVDGVGYPSLQDAIDAAEAGDTVNITADKITVDLSELDKKQGYYNIERNITINGNGCVFKATSTVTGEGGRGHIFVVKSEATLKNFEIDGSKQLVRYGIQAYGSGADVTIDNVYAHDCYAYGFLANNGAKLTIEHGKTADNGWGGVNADTNGGASKLVIEDGYFEENCSVVVENGNDDAYSTDVDLKGGYYKNIQVKTAKTDVEISGGSYTAIIGSDDPNYEPDGDHVAVTGGKFKTSVDEFVDGSEYPYEAVSAAGIYSYHKTLNAALTAAGQNGEVNFIGSSTTETHTVKLVYGEDKVTEMEVADGTKFKLPSASRTGVKFLGWSDGWDIYDAGDEYTVDDDTTFTAVWEAVAYDYDIVIDDDILHGDIWTSPKSEAEAGDTVHVYADPDAGYVLEDLSVTNRSGRNELKLTRVSANHYTFTMPAYDVYVTAEFASDGFPFDDVRSNQWFYDAVYYVWANDLMEGVDYDEFNPNGTMTRAMFWAVLGRIDGETITGTNWADEARDWAMSEGVSDGTNPNGLVTREQMVTMLWRYAGERDGSGNLSRYTDGDKVAQYATEAMRWALGNGIIEGTTATTLEPQATATRAQCAAIFMRYYK